MKKAAENATAADMQSANPHNMSSRDPSLTGRGDLKFLVLFRKEEDRDLSSQDSLTE